MPEMPEMSTYQNLLSTQILHQPISKVEVTRPKSLNVSVEVFQQTVQNQTIIQVSRRGKHLLFHLADGHILLLHLMLGGFMYVGNDEDSPNRTKQITLVIQQKKLYFIGLRLGYLHLHTVESANVALQKLGTEASALSFDQFIEVTQKKRTQLKSFLINQENMAGIGNCYADEICFRAQLLPTRSLDSLSTDLKKQLHLAIGPTLQAATIAGGYMENPLFEGDCLTGGAIKQLAVYDRMDQECLRCGHLIERNQSSKKKIFYCPGCQY